jgi:hypothetical protein
LALVTRLPPSVLKWPEDADIEWLAFVCGVWCEAKQLDLVSSCELNEVECDMRAMAVVYEQNFFAGDISLLHSRNENIFKPP